MVKLIAVVGNCGSGKTALTQKLSKHYGLKPLLEQHAGRPFQARFQEELRSYALPNQIDYLLYRAEQELELRESHDIGIADGGLDQDFHVFTKLFHRKGLLNDAEYQLCKRLYHITRVTIPAPDLLIRLTAPLDVLTRRRAARTRALDIVTTGDLGTIDELMAAWMAQNSVPVITFDTAEDDPSYSSTSEPLITQLDRILSSM